MTRPCGNLINRVERAADAIYIRVEQRRPVGRFRSNANTLSELITLNRRTLKGQRLPSPTADTAAVFGGG